MKRSNYIKKIDQHRKAVQTEELSISHDLFCRTYQKLGKILIETGDLVFQGEIIAELLWSITDKNLTNGPNKYYFRSPVTGIFKCIEPVGENDTDSFPNYEIQFLSAAELHINVDEPFIFYSPCEGWWEFNKFENMHLSMAQIGKLYIGDVDRVVELIQPISHTYVTRNQPLFRFFPQHPGQKKLATYTKEYEDIEAEIETLKKERNALEESHKREGIIEKERILKDARKLFDKATKEKEFAENAARETLCNAQDHANEIISDANSRLQSIKDDANKLELAATIERLVPRQRLLDRLV